MNTHNPRLLAAGLAAAFLLSACGGQPEPTPTPTQTPVLPATATATAVPPTETPTPLPAADSATTPAGTLQAVGTTLAAGVVAKVADDAVAFVLEQGAANVTADQLTAALIGVLGRLQRWAAGTGSETALQDCTALLPGVIARADNKQPLEALLAACQGEDPAAVVKALEAFAGMVP